MFKKTSLVRFTVVMLAIAFIVQGCNKFSDFFPHRGGSGKKSISDIVASTPSFSLLKQALKKADLYKTLDQSGTYTVFAPNDDAFKAAGFDSKAIDAATADALKAILLYHVLGSEVKAAQIPEADNTNVTTLNGKDVFVTKKSGNVSVNGGHVTQADIDASNGVIHAIDKVLVPPSGNIVELAQGNPNFTYLVAAVLRASQGTTNVAALLTGDGPLTVFAPTNQAFIDAGFPTIESINAATPDDLTPILAYHVIAARIFSTNLVDGSEPATLNGETVTIQLGTGAAVKGKSNSTASHIAPADLVATNGVVHVIDQVLLP
ncbi:MAG: fasciclin domain-containing protein [Chitinophagaceae bacterium]